MRHLNSLIVKLDISSRFVICFSLVKAWKTRVTQNVSSTAKFKLLVHMVGTGNSSLHFTSTYSIKLSGIAL
jgi:hypothetical protein